MHIGIVFPVCSGETCVLLTTRVFVAGICVVLFCADDCATVYQYSDVAYYAWIMFVPKHISAGVFIVFPEKNCVLLTGNMCVLCCVMM